MWINVRSLSTNRVTEQPRHRMKSRFNQNKIFYHLHFTLTHTSLRFGVLQFSYFLIYLFSHCVSKWRRNDTREEFLFVSFLQNDQVTWIPLNQLTMSYGIIVPTPPLFSPIWCWSQKLYISSWSNKSNLFIPARELLVGSVWSHRTFLRFCAHDFSRIRRILRRWMCSSSQ